MPYAWIIDRDLISADEPEYSAGPDNPKGPTCGPSAAPENAFRDLRSGLKPGEYPQPNGPPARVVRFRMRDDDRELYYEGRLLTWGETHGEEIAGPLFDFGMPNAGCTILEEKTKSGWEIVVG